MRMELRTTFFAMDPTYYVIPGDKIKQTANLQGYVFVDSRNILTENDIQEIKELIEERDLEFNLETVQEIASEVTSCTDIEDIGGILIEADEYAEDTLAFDEYDIYTYDTIEFVNSYEYFDGKNHVLMELEEEEPYEFYTQDPSVKLGKVSTQGPNNGDTLTIYKCENYADSYIFVYSTWRQGALDTAEVYELCELEHVLRDIGKEEYIDEVFEL